VIYSGNKLNADHAQRWRGEKKAAIRISELCVAELCMWKPCKLPK